MAVKECQMGLTFEDLLLKPGFSQVLPSEVDTSTWLTNKIRLNIPLVSAAMDTVTEGRTAISMARQGGMGFIHKNMSIKNQALEVIKVKKSESGMIVDPVTVGPDATISDVLDLMSQYRISGVPVVVGAKLVGIITNRDLRFENNFDQPVENVMTKDKLVTAREGVGTEEVKALLHEHRIEKLLVTDEKGNLKGLVTIKDIEKVRKYPHSAKDAMGRLRVGAAIGVGDGGLKRAEALIKAGVDALCLDSAHGHSQGVLDSVKALKEAFPNCQLIAGNIATTKGAEALIKAGVDAVKVGVGPGSICTTRVVAGVGVPQMSAIMEISEVTSEAGIPMIADGGIKYSGDLTKALAGGAQVVMIGSLFAGTDESPGETVLYQGRQYKIYRGMGSIDAMKSGSADRYSQKVEQASDKMVPEGIVGRVPYRGHLADSVYQLVGGLKSGMGYVGAATVPELNEKSEFVRITTAGLRESHVHDVIITKEAPNYRVE
ncbi:IMP dehydrogenase [Dethiosulfatarculus sandiegensis]|uniref:Inosine-5'-monophosphate dehydrogenase n=1 Tax=Dethiosulfatarculus sandiegensis TaxID=1429043 RepID=A0A0D2GAB4_9BACT|nr:IMP dehydrogenase [Dethiosulfatarculus sandiegensis]KIX11827.1 inosine 5'-monophosphate dehydrogenase [Dethiosulfatarculus sandiegensis]